MDEVTLYNLNASSRSSARDSQNLALVLMVKHLRIEHDMSLNDIARRCKLKVKEVKTILSNE